MVLKIITLFTCAFFALVASNVYKSPAFKDGLGFQAASVQLRILEVRGGGPPGLGRVASLGLLRNGCPVPCRSVNINTTTPPIPEQDSSTDSGSYSNEEFATVSSSCSDPATWFNGYFFETWKGSEGLDPIRWELVASILPVNSTASSDWKLVGASGLRVSGTGLSIPQPQMSFSTPTERGARIIVDMQDDLFNAMTKIPGYVHWSAGMLIAALLGHFGQPSLGRPVWILCACWDVATGLISAGWYWSRGDWMLALTNTLIAVPQLVLAVGFSFFESRVVVVFFVYSVLFVASSVLADVAIFQGDVGDSVYQAILGPALATFLLYLFIVISRRRILRRARQLVQGDRECYEKEWGEVIQQSRETWIDVGSECHRNGWIDDLQALAYAQRNAASNPPPQQRYCPLIARADSAHENCPELRPVESLDQLYMQAWCLQPILRKKVSSWASQHNGLLYNDFAATGLTNSIGSCDDLESQSGTEASGRNSVAIRAKQPRLKSVARSVEKLGRSYRQDVSRLLDVCRESIVFRHGRDLLACLRAVASDADVRLLRVKNRMDPNDAAEGSAGYRDVAINVAVSTDRARRLGVQWHVCEVQLILESFARIKSDEGHQRYVIFRNLRGE